MNYYYSRIDRVAAQIGKVSHMQAQFTQSDTIAGMISKSNTFMQSAIGVSDSYTERPPILYTASGSRIVGQLGPHCSTTLLRVISTSSLQNQLLPVISGDVSGMGTDPLEPALYYYHPDHLGSATWITDSVGNPAQFLHVALGVPLSAKRCAGFYGGPGIGSRKYTRKGEIAGRSTRHGRYMAARRAVVRILFGRNRCRKYGVPSMRVR